MLRLSKPLQQVSAAGQQDAAFLALLGDIHAHLGNTAKAEEIFRDAISRNPDNDQYYLSLTLVQLRRRMSAARSKPCRKAWPEFPAPEKFCGAWELSRFSKAKPRKPPNVSNALSNSCPSGPEAIPRWASFIIRPDKSKKPAKC